MLVDVLRDRERQIAERQRKRDIESQQDELWHDELVRQLATHRIKEDKEVAARQAKASNVARVQQDQLTAYRDTYIAQLMEEKEEGIQVSLKCERDAAKERADELAKRARERQNRVDVAKANLQLKEIKGRQALVVQEEEKKIEQFSRDKLRMATMRKEREHQKHLEDQGRRQAMIDRAVRELAAAQKDEGARLSKQEDEVREKADKEESDKANRRRRQQVWLVARVTHARTMSTLRLCCAPAARGARRC